MAFDLKPFLQSQYLVNFIAGAFSVLGFAPFHLPGILLFCLTYLYIKLQTPNKNDGFFQGLTYGLGFFGFGIYWVSISIHDYGNLNYAVSAILTLLFIGYLALYPALVGFVYQRLIHKTLQAPLMKGILFSSLWLLSEVIRSNLLGGFPWLLIGISQIDTPLKYLLPILGTYGTSAVAVFACTLFAVALTEKSKKRIVYAMAAVLVILLPSFLNTVEWTKTEDKRISVGVVQANLAMRDKWDEALFWNLLRYYDTHIQALLGKDVIILPESAIPLPSSYLNDYLQQLDSKAKDAKSALILGILESVDNKDNYYYNALLALGKARGEHIKTRLVPFGEYLPKPLEALSQWLHIPTPNILPGKKKQPLIRIKGSPIASLICYEIAYPETLLAQLPKAKWIVSISDNGWFGHSSASHQQLQMAQVNSMLTGRYQVLVNNDGLSSIINPVGTVIKSLPAFSEGILQGHIFAASLATPWVSYGNKPAFYICLLFVLYVLLLKNKLRQGNLTIADKLKRGYSYRT